MAFNPMHIETPTSDLQALSEIAASRAGNHMIEVGSWAGGTARILAQHASRLYCVDTWEGSSNDITGRLASGLTPKVAFQTFCQNMGHLLLGKVFPCVGRSLTWASIWPEQVSLIFIDANHDYEHAKADIDAWWPHLSVGGVMVIHDYGVFPGVTQAVDERFPHRHRDGYCLAYVTKGDVVSI